MDDERIVELYWQRNENAISETAAKYGKYLHGISYRILANTEDADECVNDTYSRAWDAIPPHRPSILSTFLGKITRRISIDRWRMRNAGKRGGGEIELALDELQNCISDNQSVEEISEQKEKINKINLFLRSLPDSERRVFLCRYWYLDSISSIARQFGFSESKVKSMLLRTREKLRVQLEKEDY